MTTPENWNDLYGRLKRAEVELEELADATNDVSEASRLTSKMHGVSLARDYMRGYHDPSAAIAADPTGTMTPAEDPTMSMDWADRMVYFVSLLLTTPDFTLLRNEQEDYDELIAEWRAAKTEDAPAAATGVAEAFSTPLRDAFPTIQVSRGGINYPEPQPTRTLSVWKFVVSPFYPTKMPVDATILHVGEQGTDICVWALIDPSIASTEYRNINAYGTGHSVPDNPGRHLGSVQMRNGENAGLVFHLFDGDDV